MEQNPTIAESIKHCHIICIIGINPQLLQHMSIQKEKYYQKVYMHFNRNVLVDYQKIKVKKTEETDMALLSEFISKVLP